MKWFRQYGIMMLIFSFSASGIVRADEKPTWVFLLGGQSNMVGWGLEKELSEEQKTLPANVEIRKHMNGKPYSGRRFGPELTFAQEIGKHYPDQKILILKDATGGTSLLAWAPDYSLELATQTGNAKDGPLYEKFQKVIAGNVKDCNIRFMGMLWMQGERDSKREFAANDYAKNLKTLIAAFRKDCSEPEMPFVLGLINPVYEKVNFVETVRAAQAKVAAEDEMVALVSTDGLSKKSDNVHYNTKGQLELGRRFAEIMIPLLEK